MTPVTPAPKAKATFNLTTRAAKRAETLTYVGAHGSVSRYIETLINARWEERQANMVPIQLKPRKTRK
jgi:hypothetical protein